VRRLLLAAALTAALAGCGGSSSPSGRQLSSNEAPAPSAAASCVPASPVAEAAAGTTDLAKKPEVEVPDGPPPCDLVIGDIVPGTGAAAKAGDMLTMKYVGVLYATGKQFDASWDRGQDFTFGLGAQQVIQGWDQGLVGMKVGGRRQLIIPPQLGYGDQGAGADIPPGATLIFVVDLVKIG